MDCNVQIPESLVENFGVLDATHAQSATMSDSSQSAIAKPVRDTRACNVNRCCFLGVFFQTNY